MVVLVAWRVVAGFLGAALTAISWRPLPSCTWKTDAEFLLSLQSKPKTCIEYKGAWRYAGCWFCSRYDEYAAFLPMETIMWVSVAFSLSVLILGYVGSRYMIKKAILSSSSSGGSSRSGGSSSSSSSGGSSRSGGSSSSSGGSSRSGGSSSRRSGGSSSGSSVQVSAAIPPIVPPSCQSHPSRALSASSHKACMLWCLGRSQSCQEAGVVPPAAFVGAPGSCSKTMAAAPAEEAGAAAAATFSPVIAAAGTSSSLCAAAVEEGVMPQTVDATITIKTDTSPDAVVDLADGDSSDGGGGGDQDGDGKLVPTKRTPPLLYIEFASTVVVYWVVLLVFWNCHLYLKLVVLGIAALYYFGLHVSLAWMGLKRARAAATAQGVIASNALRPLPTV